jgi:hypothetical protein
MALTNAINIQVFVNLHDSFCVSAGYISPIHKSDSKLSSYRIEFEQQYILQHMLHTLYVAKVINAELFVKYM